MSSLGHPQAGDDGWASVIDKIYSAVDQGYWEDCTYANGTGAVSTNATFASATTFTVPGDQTTVYVTARRLRIVHAGGTTYCEVLSSSFASPTTTVTISGITSGPTTLTTPITAVALSLIFRGVTGNESHTLVSTTLAADTVFSSCANVYTDGASVTLDAGKWMINAITAVSRNPAAAATITLKLWDGVTLLNSAQITYNGAGAGDTITMPLFGIASSSGTWKVSAACSGASTGNLMRISQSGSSTPGSASVITAVKVL